MTHDKLVNIAEQWLLRAKGCGFAFRELHAFTYNGEIPDAIGWRSGITILVECKSSRSDFLSDSKKAFREHAWMGMGAFRFFMCPDGIIQKEDLPEKWGLVWVNKKGKAIQKVGPRGNCEWSCASEFFHTERNTQGESAMMVSALRRLHLRGLLQTIYDDPRKGIGHTEGKL